MEMVSEIHPSYDMYQLFFSPSDTGHAGAARQRTYVIASHVEKTSCKLDPYMIQSEISRCMQRKVKTQPKDYCLADAWEVAADAMALANKKKLAWRPPSLGDEVDLRPLLTAREARALKDYEAAYFERFGRPASSDKNLVCFLADNPAYSLTWSAVSKRLPTLRLNSSTGKLWLPSQQRWMVARERLAAMAWPIHTEMAQAMGCPDIPVRDLRRAGELAGNGMHFTTVAVAQLIALSCFGPIR